MDRYDEWERGIEQDPNPREYEPDVNEYYIRNGHEPDCLSNQQVQTLINEGFNEHITQEIPIDEAFLALLAESFAPSQEAITTRVYTTAEIAKAEAKQDTSFEREPFMLAPLQHRKTFLRRILFWKGK